MTDNPVFSSESKNIECKVPLPDKSGKYMNMDLQNQDFKDLIICFGK